jgi:hypothetical protein
VAGLIGHENATLKETDAGIDVVITADDDVEELQDEVAESLDAFIEARDRLGQRQGFGRRGRDGDMPPVLHVLLMHGEANVTARNTDDGVIVSITGADPEAVEAIQKGAPQWQERSRKMKQAREHMRTAREARRVLTDENVVIETIKTANGVTVTITSDDAETQERIQKMMPEFFEHMQQMPERDRDRDRERRGGRRRGDGDEEVGRRRGRGRQDGDGGRRGGRRRADQEEDEDDE